MHIERIELRMCYGGQMDKYLLLLPDAIDTVRGLRLFCWVPVPFQVNNVVSSDNRQPYTRCDRRHDQYVEA